MLSTKQKNDFLNKIIRLRKKIDAFKAENILQELQRFENQLTLNELEACLFNTTTETFETQLIELLALRWERIRGSSLCYTQQPSSLVNQWCLELATVISPDIEALEPNTGPYCLLMPSLENSEDIFGENIHSLGLHEFVLSDNERVFIPLAACLYDASISDEGQLRQMVSIDGKYPELTPSEVKRVSNHSKEAVDFYKAILTLNKQRLLGDDIGAKLSQLVVALRGGGSHSGLGSGTELNAGAEANLGILQFYDYWQGLSQQKQNAILEEAPELKDIFGRLFRPTDVNYKQTVFCVDLMANAIDKVIKRFNNKPAMQILQKKVDAQETAFKAALKKPQDLVIIHTRSRRPKHILHLIFKLSAAQQKKIFKESRYENALLYALSHKPEALPEFELDEASKQQAIEARIQPKNDSGLIVAAKCGEIAALKLLLEWGADIEASDTNGSTALHWAANNGHIDVVNCLLKHGASLEARGDGGLTALNFAVCHGQAAVVNQLLKVNANMDVRTDKEQNALDLAIAKCPELIEPILLQMATLPADKQVECLLNVPDGPYPNVFFYAAAHKLPYFNALIAKTLEQPKITANDVLFTTENEKGYTPLILAAQLGAKEGIHALLDLGLDIESSDANGSNALHWAANNGHLAVVNCLLEQGAALEARGIGDNTALHFAVIHGHRSVVKQLLKVNADVNARNDKQRNALDIAIDNHPELVEPILLQLATLSADKQAECLLNVPEGPYPNVFLYAAAKHPSLFNDLITKALQQPKITANDILFTTANEKGYTPLILAAQLGAKESVQALLDLGLDIESSDAKGTTALHWAAYNGHMDTVNCLLEHEAALDAQGDGNHTALNFAVFRGQAEIVNRLLKENANINVRSLKGNNALDLAIANHPDLVEPILMQLATLPADKQAECLLNVPEGPYPNVFLYAAAKHPSLFNNLITKALQQPKITANDILFTTANEKGYTPLILAVQLRANESIHALLNLGLDIESADTKGCTALHWAAYNGHMDNVNCLLQHEASLETQTHEENTALHLAAYNGHLEVVNCLLKHRASLEARGNGKNTALHFAVVRGHTAVAKRLLKKNADINARDSKGYNVLDIANASHPELVYPILMQLATLPINKQAECLRNLPNGPYSSVFFYAATEKPQLLNKLFFSLNQDSNLDAKMEPFHKYLREMGLHYQLTMKSKAPDNANYIAAVFTAETLLTTCIDAMLKVYQGGADIDANLLECKKSCELAIKTARPVLKQYREWDKVLGAFLLFLVTLPISLPLYAFGIFSDKTKSEQLLDKMEKAVNKFGG